MTQESSPRPEIDLSMKHVETSEPRPYEPGGDPASIIKAEGVTPKDLGQYAPDDSGKVPDDAKPSIETTDGEYELVVMPDGDQIYMSSGSFIEDELNADQEVSPRQETAPPPKE